MTGPEKLLAALMKGAKKDWRYGELAAILELVGFHVVAEEGSHRSWKHPSDPNVLTLPERNGHMLRCYFRDVRKRVKALQTKE